MTSLGGLSRLDQVNTGELVGPVIQHTWADSLLVSCVLRRAACAPTLKASSPSARHPYMPITSSSSSSFSSTSPSSRLPHPNPLPPLPFNTLVTCCQLFIILHPHSIPTLTLLRFRLPSVTTLSTFPSLSPDLFSTPCCSVQATVHMVAFKSQTKVSKIGGARGGSPSSRKKSTASATSPAPHVRFHRLNSLMQPANSTRARWRTTTSPSR